MPTRARSWTTSMPEELMSSPSSSIRPSKRALGMVSFIRLRVRRKVDLPQPDGPMKAVTCSRPISIDTSSTAFLSPYQTLTLRAVILSAGTAGACACGAAGMSAAGWSRLWSMVAFTQAVLELSCRHPGEGRGPVSRAWRPSTGLDSGLRRNDGWRVASKAWLSPPALEPVAEIDGDAVHREQEDEQDDDRGRGLFDEAAADLVRPEEDLH